MKGNELTIFFLKGASTALSCASLNARYILFEVTALNVINELLRVVIFAYIAVFVLTIKNGLSSDDSIVSL